MDFSLILPSLGESYKVKRFLDSVERTTSDLNNIEVLFAIDEGKTEIVRFVEDQGYSFKIKFYQRPVTDNFSNDYYNWLTSRSQGMNVWACNDDMWILTNWWDDIIRDKIARYRWNVYLVDTKDKTRDIVNKGFCCFPIVSREAINEIGFMFYPQIRIYPADKAIYGLYKEVGRIIPAHEVRVNNTYASEDGNQRLWKIFQEDVKSGVLNVDITRETMRLLYLCKDDPGPLKESKLSRIVKILKEK